MSFDHIRSWFELEEINEQQERTITFYENEIKQLEEENAELKEELKLLKQRLEEIIDNETKPTFPTVP